MAIIVFVIISIIIVSSTGPVYTWGVYFVMTATADALASYDARL